MKTTKMYIEQWMDKGKVVYAYNEPLFSLKKGRNPAICNCNTDGPRRHYAKWNKSDTERNTLHDFIYILDLK